MRVKRMVQKLKNCLLRTPSLQVRFVLAKVPFLDLVLRASSFLLTFHILDPQPQLCCLSGRAIVNSNMLSVRCTHVGGPCRLHAR